MRTPEEEALLRIHHAAETGATTLDLSWLGLTALPPEIGQLVSLHYPRRQVECPRSQNLPVPGAPRPKGPLLPLRQSLRDAVAF